MIKPGLFIWIFKDDAIFYIRFFRLIGFGWEFIDGAISNGIVFIFGIWKFELGIHLGKRKGNYVKRNENEKSPTASA